MSNRPWKTALITGGTTGIGASLAKQLAAEGTRVAFCARRKDLLDDMSRSLGEGSIAMEADCSDPRRAAQVVTDAASALGGLDLVIANAGTGKNCAGRNLTLDHVLPILQLNVLGACATLTAAIPDMAARGGGHLVGISSVAGYRGLPTAAAYSASKAALSTFLESLRVDLRSTGIRVTDIRPGFIDTPLTAKNKFRMPFLLGPDEAARRILRAIERGRAVYTFPWQMALAIRLVHLAPNWLYDSLAPMLGARADPKPKDLA